MDDRFIRPTQGMPKNEKIVLGLFVVIGLFSILLIIFQMGSHLALGVVQPTEKTQEEARVDLKAALDLQKKDTDQDGLSDFEELHVYNTSPYLADSDSDGFTDKQELEASEDPNCPRGQECAPVTSGGGDISTSGSESTLEGLFDTESLVSQLLLDEGAVPAIDNPDIATLIDGINGGGIAPNDIRAALLQFGVSDDEVSQFTDEELQQLADFALQELANNPDLTESLFNF